MIMTHDRLDTTVRGTGTRAAPAHGHRQQRGAVLFISLIMLLAMTLIGITGMQATTMEEKMAGNLRDINLSFQATEAALREGESLLQAATLPDFDGSNVGLYQPAQVGSPPLWEVPSTWASGSAIAYGGSLDGIPAGNRPLYIIEELAALPNPGGSLASDNPLPETHIYRITARGMGGNDRSVTILQSTYKR
ncbi:MAG TPA: hypothetical protein ENK05_10625 [Gammaproteobacteria bacterium]|nr:hypothetical protein [Gammaproteobacteria bacterium]